MRSSVKKARMMSIEEVEENDELLMIILVRLPPKSIFKFKCVSKRWNRILVDQFFLESYRARSIEQPCGRLIAFIQNRLYTSYPNRITILPIMQPNEYKMKQLPSKFYKFYNSSEGLILCAYQKESTGRYYWGYVVLNPLNRTWVELPQPNSPELDSLGLVSEVNTQEHLPSFRVLGIAVRYGWGTHEKTMILESYSSRTNEWTTLNLIGTVDLARCFFHHAFVFKGVFYWHAEELTVMVYDSNRDEKCMQFMKLPPEARNHYFFLTRAPRDDAVWVGTSINENICRSSREIIKFWKLREDEHGSYKYPTTITEDQWVCVHTLDHKSVCKEMTILLESKKRKKSVDDSNLKLEALIPSDPVVAVLSLREKIFFYNIESKSLELVQYRNRPFGFSCCNGWHPFMESASLSTYAPFLNSYD